MVKRTKLNSKKGVMWDTLVGSIRPFFWDTQYIPHLSFELELSSTSARKKFAEILTLKFCDELLFKGTPNNFFFIVNFLGLFLKF